DDLQKNKLKVEVAAFNSKVYYVLTDFPEKGEQVYRFPCTGKETVLDALAQVDGLPRVAAEKHIWISRCKETAAGGTAGCLLTVDWLAITRDGLTATNYQLQPGDRIFVKDEAPVTTEVRETMLRGVSRLPASWKLRHSLTGHLPLVQAVAFSPDHKTLAVGSSSGVSRGEVRLWDVETGKERATLTGHQGQVVTLVFSPDGKTLASGCTQDESVKLWDVATGKERATLEPGSAATVTFSPDGRTLAVGTDSVVLSLWDVPRAKETSREVGHEGRLACLAYSPDGRLLASGGWDRTVKLWDAATGKR